ncbi:hypothetical protein [Phenylobacterium sp. J367]|uniref:hypothetical protein n=1 Tax=Phenylobacterium sp. J367 TaxID=2898435 RepID=UPI002151504E|nr:hypothetical protein [Phenylobacterium sp. J367]MCR5879439.1 hypothetical protein [Phenylobacterium sp. J367]
MRLEWQDTGEEGKGFWQARLRKPASAPPGYTRNTVVTEWLTLNCRGDWSSHSGTASLRVRFRSRDDLERALEMFGGARSD